MLRDFTINEIYVNNKTKTITLTPAYDIDPNSINDTSIQIMDRTTRELMDYDFIIEKGLIHLTLKSWPVVNRDYLLIIKDLKNVLGEDLAYNTKKRIIFKSSITNTCNIISPAFNEEIESLLVSLKEEKINEDSILYDSFYVEVSTDSNFHNIVINTMLNSRDNVSLKDIKPGQYYIRARVETDEDFGFWSNTITFFIKEKESIDTNPENNKEDNNDEDISPIIISNIKVINTPEQGITPNSFIFEFDCPIDSDFLDNIVVIRKDV